MPKQERTTNIYPVIELIDDSNEEEPPEDQEGDFFQDLAISADSEITLGTFAPTDKKDFQTFIYYLSREDVDTDPYLVAQIWADKVAAYFEDKAPEFLQGFDPLFARTAQSFFSYDEDLLTEVSASINEELIHLKYFFDALIEEAREHDDYFLVATYMRSWYLELSKKIAANINELDHEEVYNTFKKVLFARYVSKPNKKKLTIETDVPALKMLNEPKKKDVTKTDEPASKVIQVGDLILSNDNTIQNGRQTTTVGERSSQLLKILMENPNVILTKRKIVCDLLGKEVNEVTDKETNLVTGWVRALIKGIQRVGVSPQAIYYERGKGYILYSQKINGYKSNESEPKAQVFSKEKGQQVSFKSLTLCKIPGSGWNIKYKDKEGADPISDLKARLIIYLCHNADSVVTTEQLMLDVWHEEISLKGTNKLSSTMSNVRKLLHKLGFLPGTLSTIRRKGYQLNSENIE